MQGWNNGPGKLLLLLSSLLLLYGYHCYSIVIKKNLSMEKPEQGQSWNNDPGKGRGNSQRCLVDQPDTFIIVNVIVIVVVIDILSLLLS